MKQMTKKIMPLMSTLLLLVAMLVPIGAWGQYYKAELFTNNPKKGTPYAYLGDAIEDAKASKKQPTTVKLLENDTLGIGANYVFDKGDVTLDLNGDTIFGEADQILKIVAGGKLTIIDSSTEQTGRVLNTKSDGHAIKANGGSLTIHGGSFEGKGWGLYVTSSSADVSLDGGRFISSGNYYGGVCNTYGKSTLAYGYAYYNTTTGAELGNYLNRPIADENDNYAKDITVKKASVKATLTVGSTTTDCYTFEKAFEDAMNAGSAATVKLMKDGDYYKLYGSYADFVTFDKGDVTLDLNGHKLYTSSNAVLKVVEGGKLTVTDTSADKTGIVMNGGGYGVKASGGSVTIHNGTFQGGSWGLYVDSPSANVSVDGGRFISGNAGGVCNTYGKSTLVSGYAYYNTSTGVELGEYTTRPICDENGNTATDITVKKASVKATLTVGSTTTDCYTFERAFGDALNAGSAATLKLMADGDYYKLYGSYADFVTFDKGDVTLDLNGHKLYTSSNAVLKVVEGGKLTVTDTSADKTGIVMNGGGYGVEAAGGSLTIHAGNFQGGSWGLYVSSPSANVSVDGGRFISGNAGGVCNTYGKSTLVNGYAYYNTTTGAELSDYTDRPVYDESGNDYAKDITVKKASVKATLTVGSTATDYYTFERAFGDAMNAGSTATVKMVADYKLIDGKKVTFNKGDVTLDLNGHIISANYDEVIRVADDCKLTITDTSADKAGKVLNKGGYGINAAGGSLTIHAGTFQGGGSAFGLLVSSVSANVSVDGGRFIGGVCNTYGKSALVYGYSYYNTTTGAELSDYTDRPVYDESGNDYAKDITVKKATVKATLTVGSTATDYYTFERAFGDAMNAGSTATVKMVADYKLIDGKNFNFNKGDVTLDLNGHIISANYAEVIRVADDCKLTITDTSADKAGKVVNAGAHAVSAAGGSLTIHAGTFEGKSGFGLMVQSSSVKASVDGGRFVGRSSAVWTYGTSALAKNYAYYDTTTGVALDDKTKGSIKDAEGNDVKDITVKINPDVVAANKFKEDHADILAETVNSVTLDDKDTVEDALADYDKLSDGAKSLLTEEKQLLDDMLDKINGWLEAGDALKDLQEKYNDLINDKVMMILINSDEKLSAELYDEIAPEMEKLEDLMKQGIETGDPTYSEFKDIIAGLSDDIDKLKNDAMSLYPEGPYAPIIVDLMGINQQVAKLNERDGDIRGDLKLTNLWNRVMDQIAAEQNRLVWDVENNPDPSDLRLAFHYTNLALIHTSIAIYDEAVKQHLTKDEKIQSIFDALLKLVSSRDKMAYQYGPYLDDQPEWKSICARLEVEETAVNALEGSDPTVEELNAHETELSAISAAMEAFAAKLASDPTGISSAAKAEGTVNGVYNLRGQKVSSNFKGIVIKNGKKVMVK